MTMLFRCNRCSAEIQDPNRMAVSKESTRAKMGEFAVSRYDLCNPMHGRVLRVGECWSATWRSTRRPKSSK
jgi:hypothetical protein